MYGGPVQRARLRARQEVDDYAAGSCKVAEGLEVRQVGTAFNLADIGAKPLSKARLELLPYWCNARDAEGNRVGEKERHDFQERVAKGTQGIGAEGRLCGLAPAS